MAENADITDRAAAKLLAIVASAARHARARLHDELSAEELAALMAGPTPKRPLDGSLERHLMDALLDDGKRR
jgi:hypothetical protein